MGKTNIGNAERPPETRDYLAFLGRQVSAALERKVREGGMVNRIPLGYLPEWAGDKLRAVPDPNRAPLVRKAFELAAVPRNSLRIVVEEVNRLGLRNHAGKPLAKSTVHLILTNPFYAGVVRYKRESFAGVHEPLISRALFEKVQDRLQKRRC